MGGARCWAVSACQKAAAQPDSPGTRSSVPTRQTRCGPGSGGEGGPRVGIGPGVGASGVSGLSVQVQNLESKSQRQTWRLRSGLSCHEAGSPKGQTLWSEKELKFMPGWRGSSDLSVPKQLNADVAR